MAHNVFHSFTVDRQHSGLSSLQAGGKGSTGFERVLDVCPDQVHQRVPLFIGSKGEVEYLESFLNENGSVSESESAKESERADESESESPIKSETETTTEKE